MTLTRGLLGALMAGLVLTGCGSGSSGFGGPLDMGTDIVVADIDADGRADVLSLTHQYGDQPVQGVLSVRRQTAPGVFAPTERYTVGCTPWSMTLADLDGDGLPEVLVADVGAYNCAGTPAATPGVVLLRTDPALPGRFLAPVKLVDDVRADRVAAADLNGDGAPDIVFGEPYTGSNQLWILVQDPSDRGQFAPAVALSLPGSVSEIASGDIDGDGRADLLLYLYFDVPGDAPNSALAIVMQQADGTLAPPVVLDTQIGLNAQALAIADVDGDGYRDLLAHLTPFSTDFHPVLRVLRQGPTPLAWRASVDTALRDVDGIDATAFGDVDLDGLLDVVLSGSWPEGAGPLSGPDIRSRVNLFHGMGGASFAAAVGIDLPFRPEFGVTIDDVDGDGRPDIAFAGDGLTAWWMRQGAGGSFEPARSLP